MKILSMRDPEVKEYKIEAGYLGADFKTIQVNHDTTIREVADFLGMTSDGRIARRGPSRGAVIEWHAHDSKGKTLLPRQKARLQPWISFMLAIHNSPPIKGKKCSHCVFQETA